MNPNLGQILSIAEHIAIGIAVVVTGFLLARWARKALKRTVEQTRLSQVLGPSMAQLLSIVAYLLIVVVACFVGLLVSGVPDTIVTLILLVVVVMVVVVVYILSLALQQSVANLAATVVFLVFQPFKRGEVIETMGRVGTVREILPFNTVIELADYRLVSLPNSKIQETGVVNHSRTGHLWADVSLNVSYEEDLDRVRAVLADVAAKDSRILADPPFEVFVEDFGERGVRLNVRPTVLPVHLGAVRSDLRTKIKSRFETEGIQFAIIPPPLRPVIKPVESAGRDK